jgi:hypothetical protein
MKKSAAGVWRSKNRRIDYEVDDHKELPEWSVFEQEQASYLEFVRANLNRDLDVVTKLFENAGMPPGPGKWVKDQGGKWCAYDQEANGRVAFEIWPDISSIEPATELEFQRLVLLQGLRLLNALTKYENPNSHGLVDGFLVPSGVVDTGRLMWLVAVYMQQRWKLKLHRSQMVDAIDSDTRSRLGRNKGNQAKAQKAAETRESVLKTAQTLVKQGGAYRDMKDLAGYVLASMKPQRVKGKESKPTLRTVQETLQAFRREGMIDLKVPAKTSTGRKRLGRHAHGT